MGIKINTKELARLERQLGKFKDRAMEFATMHTLNDLAFTAQRFARRNAKKEFTIRNKFTIRSIRVNKTKAISLERQKAATGSTEEYMRRQEVGGTTVKRGRVGIPITTKFASGEEGAGPRRKLARPSNRLKNIRLRKQRRTAGMPRKQRIFLTIRDAIITKNRHIFLDLGRKKGIFRVVGGTRKNVSAARIRMVADLTEKTTRTPRSPWLFPAAMEARKFGGLFYRRALQRQIDRLALFKDRP